MNNENLAFLLDTLKYLGFGEKVIPHEDVAVQVEKGLQEFRLWVDYYFDEISKMGCRLYFRKSTKTDIYFFNKYDAVLSFPDEPHRNRMRTFYINKGTGVTFKEAYNLLQGRAVNKNIAGRDGVKYNAWIQLNFTEKDLYDNYKIRQYREQYGYDLNAILEKYSIREMKYPELQQSLLRSLRRGNLHAVTLAKNNKLEKMFIEANPQFKTVNLFPFKDKSGEITELESDPDPLDAAIKPVEHTNTEWEEEEEEESEMGELEEVKEEKPAARRPRIPVKKAAISKKRIG